MEVMKQLRQRAIRDLVDQRPIRTQQELAAALRERGFRTTQATISRDVAELGLIKVTREGTAAYALPPRLIEAETSGEDRLRKLLSDLPLEIHEAGLLLVAAHAAGVGPCHRRRARPRPLAGGRRAPSPATTRSSWPCRTAGSLQRDQAAAAAPVRGRSGAALTDRPDAPRSRALTPTRARLPFAPGRNFRRADTARGTPGVLSFIA